MTARARTAPRPRAVAPLLLPLAIALAAFLARPTPARAIQFGYEPFRLVASDTLGALVKIQGYVVNYEPTPQTFTIVKVESLPPDPSWTASICVRDLCYAPFVNRINKNFAAQESILISAYVQVGTLLPGSGDVWLSIMPQEYPEEAIVRHLTALSVGLDVLIVDDGAGPDVADLAAASLPVGKTSGVWPRANAAPVSADLAAHGAVLWLAGHDGPGLDGSDRAAIDGYLDGGGRLLVAGGNVAYDLCDPASPNATDETRAWISERLHVAYAAGDGGSEHAAGTPGDSIGDGLAILVSNPEMTEPEMTDGIAASGGGTAFIAYEGTERAAAVRATGNAPRTVFLALDFESTGDAAARERLVERSLDFFEAPPGAFDPPRLEHPDGSMLGANSPNPFRPTTRFAIRAPEGGPARVRVVDASGRHVRTLLEDAIRAGETPVEWNGRTDDGEDAPSGIYFVILTHGGQTETRKIDLLR